MDRIMGWLIRCVICLSRFSKFLSGAGLCRYDERTPDGPLRILLAGYNGARNTGADVRVISIARQLLSLYGEDELQVTVMTMDPDNMKGYFPENVRMLKFSPIYMLDLWKACSGHHAVILCEGSTLTGTFANALAMFYIEAAGIMKMQGKPSIAYGSEVGPMEPWLEKMARKYCSETYFITRTEHALERLHQLGLRGHQGTDTAWSFEADGRAMPAGEELKMSGWDGRKPVIGAAVIDPFCWPVRPRPVRWILSALSGNRRDQYKKWYFFSRSPERRKLFEKYLRNVAAAVNRYAEKNNCFVAVIGMEALDLNACERFRGMLRVPCALFCASDHDAFRMTAVLRSLSALVTSRYHAAVLSMEKGVPIVSVSMDERLDELMEEAGADPAFRLRTDDPELGRHLYAAMQRQKGLQSVVGAQFRQQAEKGKNILEEMGNFLKNYLEDERIGIQ
ncbi:MAG: polysaccharide pyruvyl transferase family protein [Lachnospiraceae bacterium]|nr:polysaccharide pyruvyl transferase family protein [Lachnospiraceae bacterium]